MALNKIHTQKGLIFVEMLVVIALIGLLLSIVVTSIRETQKQARDSVRIVNVNDVSKALAIYYIKNNRFPVSRSVRAMDGEDVLSQELLKEGLLRKVPLDPLYPTFNYYYVSNVSGTDYLLTYCLETNIFEQQYKGCGNTLAP